MNSGSSEKVTTERRKMNTWRLRSVLLVTVCLITGGVVFFFCFLLPKDNCLKFGKFSSGNSLEVPSENSYVKKYDFHRLLVLVDEYNKIKRCYYGSFNKQERKRLKPEVVDEFIKAASNERNKLQNYIWLLESHIDGGLSFKKKQALFYYLKTSEKILKNLKKMRSRL
jgi:hypothetical protein